MSKPSYHGSARQSFGSGALRTPDDDTFNKIHKDKKEKLRIRDEREHIDDTSSSSHGVLIKTAPFPPYNARYPGGKNPPHHTSVHDPLHVFRPSGYGTRRDDLWIHQGIAPSRDNVFRHEEVLWDETSLLTISHQNPESPTECDATCGPMEFFCAKSCSCIGSDLHCGTIDMVSF